MPNTPTLDPAYPTFVGYIDRTRNYYEAHGYDAPYRYAFHTDVPFTPLPKPLAQCRLGLVTTAMPLDSATNDSALRPKRVYAASVDPPPERLYADDLAWHKEATNLDDTETYLPIGSLQAWRDAGRFAELSPRFYGLPTEYSQRSTRETDAPALLKSCQEDRVDVALLVPI